MASSSESPEEDKSWEQVLRRMLPAGAPLPDEDHLDYSIAVEYEGLPVPYDVPRVDPLEIGSTVAATAPVRTSSTSSDQATSSIPVAMPLYPRFSRFSEGGGGVRNGGFRSPVESQRSSSVYRTQSQFDSRNGDAAADWSDFSGGDSFASLPVVPSSAPVAFASPAGETRRPATVTFSTPRDSDSEGSDGGDSYRSPQSVASEPVGSPASPVTRQGKRGVCSRCGNMNRLKEYYV